MGMGLKYLCHMEGCEPFIGDFMEGLKVEREIISSLLRVCGPNTSFILQAQIKNLWRECGKMTSNWREK